MKHSTQLARWIAGALVVAPFGSALAAQALFSPVPMFMKAPETDTAFQALAARPSTHAMQLVTADTAQLDESTDDILLNLDFGGALDVPLQRVSSYRSEDGSLVWHGTVANFAGSRASFGPNEVANDPMNEATLVVHDGKLTGNVHILGQLYAIRPLHDGRTAIVEVDASAMPPDHPPAAYRKLFEQSMALDAEKTAPDVIAANTTIRVMVNYTQGVASQVGDVAGLINLAVAESNQGYANSGVAITMQLATSSQVTYSETGNFDTDLARYRGTSDGYMDGIHSQRNSSAADVGVLLVTNTAYCGLASAIKATASTAFAEVYWDCATGYYSFAHEIGHLQAARHDPANDPTNTPYKYGHGYQYASGGWRTIMAYDCTSGCTRLNYWSNPGITHGGHAMGTTTRNDNHRVLNNTAATVAAFR